MKILSASSLHLLLLVSCLGFSVMGSSNVNVRMKPRGEKLIKPMGSAVVLTCIAENVDPATEQLSIKWIGPQGTPITATSGRVYVEQDGPDYLKVYIMGMSTSDVGRYICVAEVTENSLTVSARDSIELLTHEKDTLHVRFIPPQQQILKLAGQDVVVLCKAEFKYLFPDKISIIWFDPQGASITSTTDRISVDQGTLVTNQELRIGNVKSSDAGNYTCKAEISEGSRSVQEIKSIVLQVYEVPLTIEEPSREVSVDLGEDVLLECVTKSSFKPTVLWTLWNSNGNNKWNDRYNQTDRGLLIRGVTKLDAGYYFCEAKVEETRESASIRIQLTITPRNKDMYIQLNRDDPQYIRLAGEELSVFCSAQDIVPNTKNLSISWLDPRGRIINTTSQSERVFILQGNPARKSLSITNINSSDTGNYTCNVNIHDDTGSYSDTKSFELLAFDTLGLEFFSPEAMAYLGQDVMLECVATGGTKPTLNTTWILPRKLQLDDRHRITDAGLLISGVTKKDAGVYTCVAERKVTQEIMRHSIKLTVMPQIGSEQLLKVLEKISDVQEQLVQLQQQQLQLQQQTIEILNKKLP